MAVAPESRPGNSAEILDLDADVRTGGFTVTADSWMGAETSGTRFSDLVRIEDGATLRVWQGATVAFDGGLEVERGA
ncbi:hypothetical protein, partial [Rubrivirga sp.]|uniref:hypothetical protein n=1 Tax=Rubrivirga sp. TaxID=1885344 RepID=UPI003C71CAE0